MSTVDDFVTALGTRRPDTLLDLLAEDVWCRALLVRELVELHTAVDTVRLFESWYATPVELHLEEAEDHAMMGRHFLRYRMRLRPHWAPDVWHRVEQSGYLKIGERGIERIDLTCTGFFPIYEPSDATKVRRPTLANSSGLTGGENR